MHKIFLTLILFLFAFVFAFPVSAAFPTLIPENCTGPQKSNECGLADVQLMITHIAQMIIGITGSVLLLMFMIGGVMYLTSGGNPEKVKKATSVLRNAVIGLAIILFAGLIVKIVILRLTGIPTL